MPASGYAIPLNADFRFIHEPLNTSRPHATRFVGRHEELEELVARIILSDGGAFLVTGYRGVGKSTFVNRVIEEVRRQLPDLAPNVGPLRLVDVHLNVPRAMDSVELMYHVLRGLYMRLSMLNLLSVLDPALRRDLELAFSRTSRTIALKTTSALESAVGLTLGTPLPGIAKSSSRLSLTSKRARGHTEEMAYLAYDDKAAEYDLVDIARRLSDGALLDQPWRERVRQWFRRPERTGTRLKMLLVFDELDKIDEGSSTGSGIDGILANLKTLFTTSGITFLFVAGKDIHDRWLDDVGRGDSIYESVFSYALYLPPLWVHADPMCDPLLDAAAFQTVDAGEAATAYSVFKRFLAFSGRGIPRRILRKFNERVRWTDRRPHLLFSRDDVRQFRFFAELNDVLLRAESSLLGELREDALSGRTDRKRLGLYYLVDWILLRGIDEFMLPDAVAASRQLSRLIAPAEQAAPDMIGRLLTLLLEQKYLEAVQAPATGTRASGPEQPTRYRLTRKRLVEMGSLSGVFEQEAQVVIKETRSQRFGPKYEVVSVIGRGGMSTVYLAQDRLAGREVAIKEQLAELGANPEARVRFEREAQALSRLHHDNIVRIYEVNAEASQPFIVMEYVDGLRLTDVIQRGALTDEAQVLSITRDVVRATQYIHNRGILWRDAKPSNIMLTPSGRVVLLDFGISRTLASTDMDAGMLLGTPAYSSPEQLRGEPLDARSDIYCIGVVLYEMVTRHLPFEGTAQAYERVFRLPEPPSAFAAISPEFERTIMKCLEPEKERRFATAALLLEALPTPHGSSSPTIPVLDSHRSDAEEKQEEHRTAEVQQPFDGGMESVPARTDAVLEGSYLVSADGRLTRLVPPRMRIGRSRDNDVVLNEPAASRFQAELVLRPQGWELSDQNSRNTTVLNGTPVTGPVVLRDGDVIDIGATVLVFRASPPHSALAPAPRVRKGDLFEFLEELRASAPTSSGEHASVMALDRAIELSRAERGFIMLADESRDLRVTTARARGGVGLPGTRFDTSLKIPRHVLETGEAQMVADLLDTELRKVHGSTVALAIRQVLCLPLVGRQHPTPLGVLYLDSRERGAINSTSVREALQLLCVELADVLLPARVVEAEPPRDMPHAGTPARGPTPGASQPTPEQSGGFYALSHRSSATASIAGDFCRVVELGNDRLGILLGEVSGKGAAAAGVAVHLADVFLANARPEVSPSRTIEVMNRAMVASSMEARFVTLFFAILARDGTLAYCNAGHIPPILFNVDGIARLEEGGPVVGLIEHATYETGSAALNSGDTLVVCSDGVTEALNVNNEEFGEHRVVTIVSEHYHEPTTQIADALIQEEAKFIGAISASDESTVLVLRYTQAAAASASDSDSVGAND